MVDSFFRETRNIELSTVYYISNQISSNWTGISVIKAFPSAEATVPPVIAVRLLSDNPINKEIGSTALWNTYNIVIDIFAKSDAQRLELADFLRDTLKDSWVYYLHSHASGSNETLNRTASGRIKTTSFLQNTRLNFSEDVEVYDKYRQLISINVKKSS